MVYEYVNIFFSIIMKLMSRKYFINWISKWIIFFNSLYYNFWFICKIKKKISYFLLSIKCMVVEENNFFLGIFFEVIVI